VYNTGGEACADGSTTCTFVTVYSLCSDLTSSTGCILYGDSSCTTDCGLEDGWYYHCTEGNAFLVGKCEVSAIDYCASDARFKTNVETLHNSLDNLLKLEPVQFDWKEITPEYQFFVEKGITHSIGFIAQQVQSVVPELVHLRNNGYFTVDYPRVNALLVEGIKEQQVFIEEVEKDIIELEKYFNL
jgi:hypothetical protein